MRRCDQTYLPLFAFLLLVAGPFVAIGNAQPLPPELEKLKSAFEKYQDPYVAVRDGYFSTVGCVEYPKGGGHGQVPYTAGGMGVHFLNPALIAPVVDVMKHRRAPEALSRRYAEV